VDVFKIDIDSFDCDVTPLVGAHLREGMRGGCVLHGLACARACVVYVSHELEHAHTHHTCASTPHRRVWRMCAVAAVEEMVCRHVGTLKTSADRALTNILS